MASKLASRAVFRAAFGVLATLLIFGCAILLGRTL
jgi:hypothetical protein